ncbi:hypothetical protein ACFE04_007342 [Oxalis oulophora]
MQSTNREIGQQQILVPGKPSSVPRPRRPGNNRMVCTCSNNPGSIRCRSHGYVVPNQKTMKRNQANREILRRALTPPSSKSGRLTLIRRWNFRPTPSRLSNMSMA